MERQQKRCVFSKNNYNTNKKTRTKLTVQSTQLVSITTGYTNENNRYVLLVDKTWVCDH